MNEFNPFATRHMYMRQLFHCLQWYAGSKRVNVKLKTLRASLSSFPGWNSLESWRLARVSPMPRSSFMEILHRPKPKGIRMITIARRNSMHCSKRGSDSCTIGKPRETNIFFQTWSRYWLHQVAAGAWVQESVHRCARMATGRGPNRTGLRPPAAQRLPPNQTHAERLPGCGPAATAPSPVRSMCWSETNITRVTNRVTWQKWT